MNVYDMVTSRIIEELEKGIIPWEKPWHGVQSGAYNRISKKPYSLLNQMLLHNQGEYASFKQWKDLGGHVRKGEKGEIIVFWKILPVEETDKDGNRIIKHIPFLKYITVFHISQLHDYINREGIHLEQEASNEAYYSPAADLIHLPLLEQFEKPEEFYSTAFHEATHSTMKESRCNRQEERKGKLVAFGSEEYSKEELVAEIGAASILNSLGIETTHSFRNSAAYIQNWLQVLRNDNRFIVSASSKAEKAINYILNREA